MLGALSSDCLHRGVFAVAPTALNRVSSTPKFSGLALIAMLNSKTHLGRDYMDAASTQHSKSD